MEHGPRVVGDAKGSPDILATRVIFDGMRAPRYGSSANARLVNQSITINANIQRVKNGERVRIERARAALKRAVLVAGIFYEL